ncbi:MAG: polymer-forming cytoskeletal protein [Alphaproteobacteria bacterium]|nr:polymer-forming cytoskeletal protein [Alphaproteobacteria bacterium]
MFTKSKRNTTISKQSSSTVASGKAHRPGPPSIVASDMRVLGDLETEGDVQIDGRIDGDLRTRTVTIGQSAVINGSIRGDTIKVAGTVNGEIRGSTVILTATAKVVGDIHHKSLSIDAGAFLQGLCKRITIDEASDSKSPMMVSDQSEKMGSSSLSSSSGAAAVS